VVLRDGRIAYDGPPVASAEDAAHGHHHPELAVPGTDYVPTVMSPVDTPTDREHGA
jgi:zinc transport system ATP-binding protein